MIKLMLSPQDFNDFGVEYEIVQVNLNNFLKYIPLIKKGIYYFNDEIEWHDMFNVHDAIERIHQGMIMYIGIINDDVFGYVWFNHKLLFNLFVRNNMPIKLHSGKHFLSNVIKRYEFNKTIQCEVDEWNNKSLKLFCNLGFRVI